MKMKRMRLARWQMGAHEHKIGVFDHAGSAIPVMGLAGQLFHFGFSRETNRQAASLFVGMALSLGLALIQSSEMRISGLWSVVRGLGRLVCGQVKC